jgi:hypothetical protein
MGFFMPMACQMNGFQIADTMINQSGGVLEGLLLYLLFVSALAGVVVGILLLLKKVIPVSADWAAIIVSIGSGLIVYIKTFNKAELQTGAYVILVGWIVALAAQGVSKIKKEG